jgi:hypothetical protein
MHSLIRGENSIKVPLIKGDLGGSPDLKKDSSVSVIEGTEEDERFSHTFLKALSKFNGAICVVTEQPDIPLQSFSPSQPNLVEDIVAWIRGTIWES